jgi:hypothetical protein
MVGLHIRKPETSMTPVCTPASVSCGPTREDLAARAVEYLRSLKSGESTTAFMAGVLGVERWRLMASLVPAQERGEVCSRDIGGGVVAWRIERRHA